MLKIGSMCSFKIHAGGRGRGGPREIVQMLSVYCSCRGAQHGSSYLQPQYWWGGDGQTPEAHWLPSLIKSMSFLILWETLPLKVKVKNDQQRHLTYLLPPKAHPSHPNTYVHDPRWQIHRLHPHIYTINLKKKKKGLKEHIHSFAHPNSFSK